MATPPDAVCNYGHASCAASVMSMRNISLPDWPSVLETMSREYRAWLATVDAEGATQALQIDDRARERLTLRFRVAVAPGMLDGLAPTERK